MLLRPLWRNPLAPREWFLLLGPVGAGDARPPQRTAQCKWTLAGVCVLA